VSLADQLTDLLAPKATDNPYAAGALCRLIAAEDPDTEAEAIVNEMNEQMRAIVRLMTPVVEAYNAWVEGGVAAAESAANPPPSF
jgi:hypothetical protein